MVRRANGEHILSDPIMSDGTHPEVIEAIMDQLRGREGMKLIGYEPDADFDRLPAEILGRPEVMCEALPDMAGKAYELIDMEQQYGRHPRVGAADTIEVYPAKGITIDEVRESCEDLGEELSTGATRSLSTSPARSACRRRTAAPARRSRRERHRRADLRHRRRRSARADGRAVPQARGYQRALGLQDADPREPPAGAGGLTGPGELAPSLLPLKTSPTVPTTR